MHTSLKLLRLVIPTKETVSQLKIYESSDLVIPGLTRNPGLFVCAAMLDARSVILDLIRDRHGNPKYKT